VKQKITAKEAANLTETARNAKQIADLSISAIKAGTEKKVKAVVGELKEKFEAQKNRFQDAICRDIREEAEHYESGICTARADCEGANQQGCR
jgi:hypothetical protein